VKIFDSLIAPWALPLESLIPPPVGLWLIAAGVKTNREVLSCNTKSAASQRICHTLG